MQTLLAILLKGVSAFFPLLLLVLPPVVIPQGSEQPDLEKSQILLLDCFGGLLEQKEIEAELYFFYFLSLQAKSKKEIKLVSNIEFLLVIGREADHDDSKSQALGIPRLVFASAIQFNKCFKFVLDNSVHVIRYDGFANVGGEGGGDETVLGPVPALVLFHLIAEVIGS